MNTFILMMVLLSGKTTVVGYYDTPGACVKEVIEFSKAADRGDVNFLCLPVSKV